ncbi:glycosyltransferase family 25 protein [Acinetobacter soli]|uniref:glycosyltransferase family 25 protein n=1 Tax=Acinetobacter soli TaxID=487316 RepID=UPI001250973D|nr:glycosyltransferase family 25 protein [Acinetobacter soli]MCE6007110.1 glycosyltransferase family 25 protein [Acinetobacter soli]
MMKYKKYLISIQKKGDQRYDSFFNYNHFEEKDFTIFGVKGNELSLDQYFKLAVANHITPLTPAELGCTLSHLEALKDFLASDAQYAYVFEDDVIFKCAINFDHEFSFLENGFILSLGGINLYLCNKARGQILKEKFYDRPILKLHPYFSDKAFYTMGYVIDRTAAQAFIDYNKIVHLADDWEGFLKYAPSISFYFTDILAHPELNFVKNTQSSIENERLAILKPAPLPHSIFQLLAFYLKRKLFSFKKKLKRLSTQRYPEY